MNQISITYSGRMSSANEVKGWHWRKSKKESDRLKNTFTDLILESGLGKMKKIRLQCNARSRHDIDALFYMGKYFVDTLVNLGKLPEDTKKYFTGVSYDFEPNLPNNTIEFNLIILKK